MSCDVHLVSATPLYSISTVESRVLVSNLRNEVCSSPVDMIPLLAVKSLYCTLLHSTVLYCTLLYSTLLRTPYRDVRDSGVLGPSTRKNRIINLTRVDRKKIVTGDYAATVLACGVNDVQLCTYGTSVYEKSNSPEQNSGAVNSNHENDIVHYSSIKTKCGED
ncbi:hypothetical protein EAF04_005008 [Stromatinia cepivora]|nr:hypothetical protein EAF04_005008 [Stromatinia cepivora]